MKGRGAKTPYSTVFQCFILICNVFLSFVIFCSFWGTDRQTDLGIKAPSRSLITIRAGAEMGQVQLKLEWDFTLIFCNFGFTGYSLVELVRWILLPSSVPVGQY